MTSRPTGSPGSHPHSDRPNWSPADNIEDYLRNCREGLESFSDRRIAKFLGMSRVEAWRSQLMAELPEGLFEHILAKTRGSKIRLTTKALAQIAVALRRNDN